MDSTRRAELMVLAREKRSAGEGKANPGRVKASDEKVEATAKPAKVAKAKSKSKGKARAKRDE
jgi:hypothetical protein